MNIIRAIDRFQQRHLWLAFPYAVWKKFSDDMGGYLTAVIAYYAFFSIFPLLLALVTVLGFVLAGDAHLQHQILSSALAQFPVVGDQLKIHGLHGNALAFVVGIVGAVWGGLAVTQATQTAFNHIWGVPPHERGGFLPSKLRGLLTLLVLGTVGIAAAVSAGYATSGDHLSVRIGALLLALVLNLTLFLSAFRILTDRELKLRQLLPGAITATVLWELLQLLGGYYIGHILARASATYGFFAIVIGLMSWLYLGAQVTLLSAEVNVVASEHLYPRSLEPEAHPAAGDIEVEARQQGQPRPGRIRRLITRLRR